MEPHGATCGHIVHLVSRLDIWSPVGQTCAPMGYRRFSVSADFFVVAKGGAFADFVLMGQSNRRICEACLFAKGEWNTGTSGGGWCKRDGCDIGTVHNVY